MNSTKTIRLLIVEDNIADIVLMCEALQEFCASPFEITTAANGEEALSLLSEGAKFDVVILDLNLPKVSGHAFLERYKSSYPPIAVFTSSWNDDEGKRALELGAREVVHKPTSYEEYVQAVCGMVLRWGLNKGADTTEAP
jgi:CheY-like chemotaxis protein